MSGQSCISLWGKSASLYSGWYDLYGGLARVCPPGPTSKPQNSIAEFFVIQVWISWVSTMSWLKLHCPIPKWHGRWRPFTWCNHYLSCLWKQLVCTKSDLTIMTHLSRTSLAFQPWDLNQAILIISHHDIIKWDWESKLRFIMRYSFALWVVWWHY